MSNTHKEIGMVDENGLFTPYGSTSNGRSVAVPIEKADYEALTEAQKREGRIYFITDEEVLPDANDVAYDNTDSGLSATNVQGAIDEVVGDVEQISSDITKTIKSATITVTAGENVANLTAGRNIIAVKIISPQGYYAIVGYSGNDSWIRIENYNGTLISEGTSVTLTYYYTEI